MSQRVPGRPARTPGIPLERGGPRRVSPANWPAAAVLAGQPLPDHRLEPGHIGGRGPAGRARDALPGGAGTAGPAGAARQRDLPLPAVPRRLPAWAARRGTARHGGSGRRVPQAGGVLGGDGHRPDLASGRLSRGHRPRAVPGSGPRCRRHHPRPAAQWRAGSGNRRPGAGPGQAPAEPGRSPSLAPGFASRRPAGPSWGPPAPTTRAGSRSTASRPIATACAGEPLATPNRRPATSTSPRRQAATT